jgi:hypothetical protein
MVESTSGRLGGAPQPRCRVPVKLQSPSQRGVLTSELLSSIVKEINSEVAIERSFGASRLCGPS